jgi:hypothetical protein
VMREHVSYMSKKRTCSLADCPSLAGRHCLNRRVAVACRCFVVHVTAGGIKLAQVGEVRAAGRVALFPCGVRAYKRFVGAPCLKLGKRSQHIAVGSTVYTS